MAVLLSARPRARRRCSRPRETSGCRSSCRKRRARMVVEHPIVKRAFLPVNVRAAQGGAIDFQPIINGT